MSETVRTDESSSKNIYGDPPKISISLPEISKLPRNSKRWKDVQLPIDILLLTVKDCEFLSCYHYVVDPFRSYFKGLGHIYFGSIGNDQDVKLKVALMKFPKSDSIVKKAIDLLRPSVTFSVGYCSGMSQESTKLGDVVVSEKVIAKVGLTEKGVRVPLSRGIVEFIKRADCDWSPPLENPTERKVEVHYGEFLMDSEVVQAEWQRDELVKKLFPAAIAIETEGGKISFSFEVTVTVKSAQRDIWIYLFPGRES